MKTLEEIYKEENIEEALQKEIDEMIKDFEDERQNLKKEYIYDKDNNLICIRTEYPPRGTLKW